MPIQNLKQSQNLAKYVDLQVDRAYERGMGLLKQLFALGTIINSELKCVKDVGRMFGTG